MTYFLSNQLDVKRYSISNSVFSMLLVETSYIVLVLNSLKGAARGARILELVFAICNLGFRKQNSLFQIYNDFHKILPNAAMQ